MHKKSRALFLIAAALLLLTSAFADTAKAQEAGTWEELEAALANGGSVTLTADVEGSTQLYAAPGDTELDLNNFTITYSGAQALFDIEESLRITDENPDGCGKILTNGVKLAEMGKDEYGDDIQLLGIHRGAFDTDPTDYLMFNFDQQPSDIMTERDGLWFIREKYTKYEAGTEPSVLILTQGGEDQTLSVKMADYQGNMLDTSQYKITSVDIAPYTEDGGESDEGTQPEGTDESGNEPADETQSVCDPVINNADNTIAVKPLFSGVAVLNATLNLTDPNDPSYQTIYEVQADVAVESNEGYALSFSEDTVWTVPNQPAVVTVTLTDANGEVVDPSEYKLLLESDAQGDEDTVIKINGSQITVTQTDDWEEDVVIYAMESGSEASGAETRSAAVSQDTDAPLKLYKVATLHIRPESERPAASSGGSGGGCNAFGGTAALFAAGALFLALRLKKK